MTHAHRFLSSLDPSVTERLLDTFCQQISELVPSVKTAHLQREMLSKFVSSDTDPAETRRTRAINKWLSTERMNEATTDRLILTPEDYQILPRVPMVDFISFCQDFIREIIGDVPPIEALLGSFSGGSSTSRTRTESHPARKFLGQAHITDRCKELWENTILPEFPLWQSFWHQVDVTVVPGNVMFTVPKKSDIDRCACKEPDLNMFVQKGIGSFFRSSLRKHGINLNDQSINRRLARVGSLTGELATLDLSSASDSVSTELVFQLLPSAWFTLLDAARCQVTVIDGDEHANHMFSSMGNGFTFELESLLFYTITKAVSYFTGTRGIVSVYGDDIVCPAASAHQVISVLSWFGFETNESKSFITGPFRESCGGHYHNGIDITPFYVKGPLVSIPDIIHLANQLREWAGRGAYTVLDPEVESLWLDLKALVPSRLWGGEDTSFKYQLVSHDASQSRLVPETKSSSTGDGGYLHWQSSAWRRDHQVESTFTEPCLDWARVADKSAAIVTSKTARSLGTYRLRNVRVSTVPRLPIQWLHEIVRPHSSSDSNAE